jgi:hypothetical protein
MGLLEGLRGREDSYQCAASLGGATGWKRLGRVDLRWMGCRYVRADLGNVDVLRLMVIHTTWECRRLRKVVPVTVSDNI